MKIQFRLFFHKKKTGKKPEKRRKKEKKVLTKPVEEKIRFFFFLKLFLFCCKNEMKSKSKITLKQKFDWKGEKFFQFFPKRVKFHSKTLVEKEKKCNWSANDRSKVERRKFSKLEEKIFWAVSKPIILINKNNFNKIGINKTTKLGTKIFKG